MPFARILLKHSHRPFSDVISPPYHDKIIFDRKGLLNLQNELLKHMQSKGFDIH